jgi:hypothetical protein
MPRAAARKVYRGATLYQATTGKVFVATKWRFQTDPQTRQARLVAIEKHDVTESFVRLHRALINKEVEQIRAEAAKKAEAAS